ALGAGSPVTPTASSRLRHPEATAIPRHCSRARPGATCHRPSPISPEVWVSASGASLSTTAGSATPRNGRPIVRHPSFTDPTTAGASSTGSPSSIGCRTKVTDVAVEVDNLSKTYVPASRALRFLLRTQIREPVVALDRVAFTVPVGGLCVVAGQNGAGKSTLFRSLVGLVVRTPGSAGVRGRDVVEQSRAVRAVIGYMASDDRTLWLRLSCIENVGFHARLRGVPPAER